MKKLRLQFCADLPDMRWVERHIPGGTYRKVTSTSCTRFEGKDVSVSFSRRYVGEGLLSICAQVKAHVRKRFRDGKIKDVAHKPRFGVDLPGRWRAVGVEIDLSSAYLEAAFKIGAVDEKIYARLKGIHKSSRLMALGCLASSKVVAEYVGGRRASVSTVHDEETTEVWRRIVAEVDRVMIELQKWAGGDFLMYWVDAIMVTDRARELILEKLREIGYPCKEKKVQMVAGKHRITFRDGRYFPRRSV